MNRVWEIDFLRGIAVIMMIVFHALYNLNYFDIVDANPYQGFWLVFGRVTALIFIFLVGVSLTLSKRKKFKEFAERGVFIFGLGLMITAVTLLAKAPILFGILHFIGVAVVVGYFFRRAKPKILILLGAVTIATGLVVKNTIPWLIWLAPTPHYAFDYFPVLPWLGVVLLGLVFGKSIKLEIKECPEWTGFVQWLGRHSLVIYMVHQPVLIAVIYLFLLP
jgi:uncharacterized membrane protein